MISLIGKCQDVQPPGWEPGIELALLCLRCLVCLALLARHGMVGGGVEECV